MKSKSEAKKPSRKAAKQNEAKVKKTEAKAKKTEAKAKQTAEVKQEKTVEVKAVRKPKTNLDRVKAVLKKQHPELSARIKDGDAMFIANRFLQNAENREKMALELKLDGRCGMCASPVKGGNCSFNAFPSTGCRNGLLGWLDTEA